MTTETTKPWLEMASAINEVRNALNRAYREQQGFETKTDDLSKATKLFGEAAKKIGDTMNQNQAITKAQITAFNQTAQGIRNAVKEMRVMELRYKGMQIAAMSFRDAAGAVTDKLTGFVNTAKTGIGAVMGFTVSVKALTDTTSAFKRSLFEADRVAERYGESLGSLKSAFETIRRDTEMSQQDFSNLNNAIKQLYLGIPPTAKALAGMVKELRGRVGYNDNVITSTLTSLVQLQGKMPQIMDRVQGAWDKAAKGQGAAANKMAAQTRYLLQQAGASRAEIEKVMSAMEPRGSRSSPFLDFEKSMAKAEQKAKDAQVALAIKLEPTLRIVAHSLSTVADILSGSLHSGFANTIALVGSFAVPLAAATNGVKGLVNAYKMLQTAAAVKFGAGMAAGGAGAAGAAATGAATGTANAGGRVVGGAGAALASRAGGRAMLGIGAAAIGLSAYDAYSQSKQRGESQAVALSKGGWRAGLGVAGGIVGAGVAGLVSKNPNAMRAGFAIGSSVASLGLAAHDRSKGGGKDEKSKESLEIAEKVKQIEANRIDQAQTLAGQIGTMFDDYQGSAKVVSDLLKGEINVGKARDYSIGKMQSIASDSERIALANEKIRANVISQAEYIKIVAGLSGSEADAKKKLADILKDITGYDKDRYVQANLITEQLNKQIAQYDVLGETSQRTIDGLAASIANLQSKGLFRTGFEDGLESAISAAEGKAGMAGKKVQAAMMQALASQGTIGELNFEDMIDASSLSAETRVEVDKAREELQKLGLQYEELNSRKFQVGDKLAFAKESGKEGETAALLTEYENLEKQIGFITEAQTRYNETIAKTASSAVSIEQIEKAFAAANKTVEELNKNGDIDSQAYQDAAAVVSALSSKMQELTLAQDKVRQTRMQAAEGPEKALLASNERAIELSKQRIQMAEAMNMGMAKSWKYNKETVALEERHLQLLTQSQARQDELMKGAAEQAGIKIDVGFATSDLEGFLADVQKQLDEKLEAKAIKKEDSVNAINAITEAANKRLDVESKIYQTTSSLLERTKQMREGWLEAITGATMGFGEMEKIIGGPDKSVTQLLKIGMPSTYKHGGFMNGPGQQRPTEYTSIYGELKHGRGGPFEQTDLERSGGIREYPGNTRGLANMARGEALLGGEPRIIARGQGTGGGIAPNMDLEILSGETAGTTRSMRDLGEVIPQITEKLIRMNAAAGDGGMPVGRNAFQGRSGWMGDQVAGGWGARGQGTQAPIKGNNAGGLIRKLNGGGYASAGQDSVYATGIPEGSFVVKEHAARGMDWGSLGGQKVGFNTGGIVALTPGEVILPPQSAAAGARAQTMGGYAFGGTVLPGKGFQNFGQLLPGVPVSGVSQYNATKAMWDTMSQSPSIFSDTVNLPALAKTGGLGQYEMSILESLQKGGASPKELQAMIKSGKIPKSAAGLKNFTSSLPKNLQSYMNTGKTVAGTSRGSFALRSNASLGKTAFSGTNLAGGMILTTAAQQTAQMFHQAGGLEYRHGLSAGSKEIQKRTDIQNSENFQPGGFYGSLEEGSNGGVAGQAWNVLKQMPKAMVLAAANTAYNMADQGYASDMALKQMKNDLALRGATSENEEWAKSKGFESFSQATRLAHVEGLFDLEGSRGSWRIKSKGEVQDQKLAMHIGTAEAKAAAAEKSAKQLEAYQADIEKRGPLLAARTFEGKDRDPKAGPMLDGVNAVVPDQMAAYHRTLSNSIITGYADEAANGQSAGQNYLRINPKTGVASGLMAERYEALPVEERNRIKAVAFEGKALPDSPLNPKPLVVPPTSAPPGIAESITTDKHKQTRQYRGEMAKRVLGDGVLETRLSEFQKENPGVWQTQVARHGNTALAEADFARNEVRKVEMQARRKHSWEPKTEQEQIAMGRRVSAEGKDLNVPIPPWERAGITSEADLAKKRSERLTLRPDEEESNLYAKYSSGSIKVGGSLEYNKTEISTPEGAIARQATAEEKAKMATASAPTGKRIPLASEVNKTTGPGFKLASDMNWTGGQRFQVVKPTNKITEVGNTGASVAMQTMAIMSHDTGVGPNSRQAQDHAIALSNHKPPKPQELATGGVIRRYAVGGAIGSTAPQKNQMSRSAEPQKVVISMDRKWEGIVGNVNSDASHGPVIY